MSIECHPCPQCEGLAMLKQMLCNSTVYRCACGMEFKISHEIPSPQVEEMLNSITRY